MLLLLCLLHVTPSGGWYAIEMVVLPFDGRGVHTILEACDISPKGPVQEPGYL